MKKLIIILAATFVAASYAANTCEQTCQKSYEDSARSCWQVKEYCFKHGPVGTEGYDYCIESWDSCLVKINNSKDLCLENCKN